MSFIPCPPWLIIYGFQRELLATSLVETSLHASKKWAYQQLPTNVFYASDLPKSTTIEHAFSSSPLWRRGTPRRNQSRALTSSRLQRIWLSTWF
jgi:hypothetical protein